MLFNRIFILIVLGMGLSLGNWASPPSAAQETNTNEIEAARTGAQTAQAEWDRLYSKAFGARGDGQYDTDGRYYTATGHYEAGAINSIMALPLAEEALSFAEDAFGPDHPNTLASVNLLAQLYAELYLYPNPTVERDGIDRRRPPELVAYVRRAEPLLLRAIEGNERALGPEHVDTLNSVRNLAFFYAAQLQYAEARSLFQRALEAAPVNNQDRFILEQEAGSNLYNLWQRLRDRAKEHRRLGQYDMGIEDAKAALSLAEEEFGPEDFFTVLSLKELALLYHHQGLYAQAEPLIQRALEGFERKWSSELSYTKLEAMSQLAWVYIDQGRYAEAEPLYLYVIEARERARGPEDPAPVASWNNLALLYTSLGRYAEAEALFLRVLEERERTREPEDPNTLISVGNLGALYRAQGRYAEAETLFQRVRTGFERTLGPEHPNTLLTLDNLGAIYIAQDRYAEAEPFLLYALDASERVLGPEHPNTLRSVNRLAELYVAQSRYAQAEPLFLRALEGTERTLGSEHIKMAKYAGSFANLLHESLYAQSVGIFYQKRAVNVIQGVRANLAELEDATQAAFLEKHKLRYETLQQWLIEAGRFAEAEQVGRMLKEQEYFEFIRRRSIGDDPRENRISLSSREADWQAEIASFAARPNELAAQRDALLAIDTRSAAQEAQLEAVRVAYKDAQRDYRVQLNAWRKEVSALKDTALASEAAVINQALTSERVRQVKEAGEDTALLQIVPLEDELHFFLTTPLAFTHEAVPVKRADLFAKIGKAREAITLGDPNRAGGPAGGSVNGDDLDALLIELHALLIAPVEQHMDDAGTETLILNLQGALRYMPFAALRDDTREDRNYLAERYRLVLYTAKGLDVGGSGSGSREARGFGVTAAHDDFSALPAVQTEMDAIFHWTDEDGVFASEPKVDANFTRAAFAEGLEEAPGIVHIASHFRLQPGDTDNSFLLLGDGGRLSLSDVSLDFTFDGVELLTLSACSTALGGDGIEVDSFGALAQDLGASAVVATLWNVADDATADLMAGFYQRFAEEDLPRAEALRQAQVELIGSEDRSHPYYWAPFILMGDWR